MSDPLFTISLFLVLVTCILCASVGFNRPTWSRSYTTAARYRAALAAHITLFLLMMLIVYALLRRGFTIFAHVEGTSDNFSESALVWISLGITLCVRAVSNQPRSWLQTMAGIPGYAQARAASLANDEFIPTAKLAGQARRTLMSRGIDLDADWLPPARPAHRLLLKATALFIQLREWESAPRFAKFAREAKNDLDLLRRRFDRLLIRISRALASIERMGEIKLRISVSDTGSSPVEVDGLIKKIVSDLIADSCEDLGAFFDDACLLAVRGTLVTESTRKGRSALLSGLGFMQTHRGARAGYGILIATGLLLYVGIWLSLLILPAPAANIHTKALIAVISIIMFGSISMAVVPKLRWGFANTGLHGQTPYAFIIGAGLCAVVFAVIVQLSAGALLIGGIEGALQRLRGGSPWLVSVFGTAATMAWLVQDTRWVRARSSRMRRLQDAVTLGVVWIVSASVGQLLNSEMNHQPIVPVTLLESVIASFVFGGVIGGLIPEPLRVIDAACIERMPLIRSSESTILSPRSVDA